MVPDLHEAFLRAKQVEESKAESDKIIPIKKEPPKETSCLACYFAKCRCTRPFDIGYDQPFDCGTGV
jgi:hypothetical protein